jgi:hypothetical protein
MQRSLQTISILLLFVIGCESDSATNMGLKGSIRGRTLLYHPYGGYETDYSGIKVSLEGTNYTAISNQSGDWEIQDVPAGIYTILFEKQGYGLVKNIGFQFVGAGTAFAPQTEMYTKQGHHAELFYVTMKDTLDPNYPAIPSHMRLILKMIVTDTVPGFPYSWNVMIFFGKTPNVSSDLATHDLVYGPLPVYVSRNEGGTYIIEGSKDSMLAIWKEWFPVKYANPGEKIYVAVYGGYYKEGIYGDYFDPVLYRSVFTSISPYSSKVLSFIVP